MAGVKVSVRDLDRGMKNVKKLAEALKSGAYTKVGFFGDSDKDRRAGDPVSNVDLAMIHEFGAPAAGIPERSFIRSTFDTQRDKFQTLLNSLVRGMFDHPEKFPPSRVLGLVGAKLAAEIKNRVTQGSQVPPPNSPATLQKKWEKSGAAAHEKNAKRKNPKIGPVGPPSAPRTLVDTSQMINSLTWITVLGDKTTGPGMAKTHGLRQTKSEAQKFWAKMKRGPPKRRGKK
jgi:hypothetical protein